MADPVSAAGTAVGITSLGLQVCQALVSYYTRFRSFDDDINAVLTRLELLECTLKSLDTVLKDFEERNDDVAQQLKKTLVAVEAGVKELEKMVNKCRETTVPASFQNKGKNLIKRVWWPFKKDTLEDMSRRVDSLQGNLQLALQILGIDTENRHFDATNTLVLGSRRIESQLGIHTQGLQVIHTGIQNVSVSQSRQTRVLNEIGNGLQNVSHSQTGQAQKLQGVLLGVQHLSVSQNNHSSSMESHMMSLSDQYRQVSMQLLSLESHLSVLGSHLTPNRFSPVIASEAFQNNIDTSRALQISLKRDLASYTRSERKTKVMLSRSSSNCSCRLVARPYKRYKDWRWFRTQVTSSHHPSCPHFLYGDVSRSLETRFEFCTRALGFCVSANIVYARSAGWTTIFPSLRYRAVVSYGSPAFKPFYNAYILLHHFESGTCTGKEEQEIAVLPVAVLSELRAAFQDGLARPTDVTPWGYGIFHSACQLSVKFYSSGLLDASQILSFLKDLLSNGVPGSEPDDLGLIPTALLFAYSFLCEPQHTFLEQVCPTVALETGAWKIPSDKGSQSVHDVIHKMFVTNDLRDVLEEVSPILGAVVGRSTEDLTSLLTNMDPEILCTSGELGRMLPYLVAWPEGLNLLLSLESFGRRCLTHYGPRLFEAALWCGNSDSMLQLIHLGVHVTVEVWIDALRSFQRGSAFSEDLQQFILEYIAANLIGEDSQEYEVTASALHICYTWYSLTPLAADVLWDAGFQEIDTVTSRTDGTPLWHHSNFDWSTISCGSIRDWKCLLQWFMDKGADYQWRHHRYLTTPAHRTGQSLGWMTRAACTRDMLRPSWNLSNLWLEPCIQRTLSMDHRDQCRCRCSIGGCRVIGCAIRNGNKYSLKGAQADLLRKRLDKVALPQIGAMVDTNRNHSWMAPAVLRVLTFDELGLTHTCCDHTRHGLMPYTEEEIHDFQIIDQRGIELLETLMEDFDAQWKTYPGTFKQFIDSIWRPRMEEVGPEISHDNEERMREIGIVLNAPSCRDEFSSGDESSSEDQFSCEDELCCGDELSSGDEFAEASEALESLPEG